MSTKNKIYKKDGKDVTKKYYPASPVLFKSFKTEDTFKVDEVVAASEQTINGVKLLMGGLKCTPLDENLNKICENKVIFPYFSTLNLDIIEGDEVLLKIETNKFDKSTFVIMKAC